MAILKTAAEIEVMAEAGRRLAGILQILRSHVKAGVCTEFFDEESRRLIKEAGCEPAFLGYRSRGSEKPYPKTICVSVNATVVHGVPSSYVLKEGDMVKLDLGVKHKGFYVDAAVTLGVGKVNPLMCTLIAATEQALLVGIREARAGKTLGDVGYAIQTAVEKKKFSIVRTLTGHGIGRELHEEPSVLNVGQPGQGEELNVGMVLAIEPMVALGSGEVRQLPDDSFVTKDGSLSAHCEHTVAITEKGPRVLTKI